MSTVNAANNKLDQTVRVFDQFYEFEMSVPAMEYDIVNSFFKTTFKTVEAAQNFTTALFRVSDQTGVPVLTILDQIQDQDQLQLTATLAYYLNGIRSPSTLLGVNSVLTPNYFTARNVLP
jgi:hypothetical protein